MQIPVAEWLPDLAADKGDQTAENVIPEPDAYRPWPSAEAYSNSLSARAQGAIAAIDKSRLTYNYAGDTNKLYVLGDQTWTNASRTTSATYTTSLDQWWEFAQWNESVIATNQVNEPQEITLGATNFHNLAGSPPRAYHIGIIRDFVVLGNIVNQPQRVQWCAINNSQSWTVDATTQADFQDLVGDGGHVQKVVGGQYGVIFQERAIWRQTYVGSPQIFSFDLVERNSGAFAAQSVAGLKTTVFYLSEEGFRVFTGGQSVAIGAGKVDRTFFADLDSSYVYRVQGIVDPRNKLYVCAYPGAGNSNGNPNKLMVYNYYAQRWALVSEEVEMLFQHISTGYTLDTLDTVSTNIDSLVDSLDSSVWAGGQVSFAGFNTSHRTVLFTGTAKSATVDTREVEHIPGRRARVMRARPLVEGLDSNITPLTRNNLSASQTVGSAAMQNSTGDCTIRSNAKYHGYRITTSGDYDLIRGVEILEVADGGSR